MGSVIHAPFEPEVDAAAEHACEHHDGHHHAHT
jgi:hypothetical protein